MAINEAAILISLLVEVSHGWQAEMCEIVPKFRKVFLAQHLRFSLIRTPSHAGNFTSFAVCSPFCKGAVRVTGHSQLVWQGQSCSHFELE
jgi:hypothetical protein